MGFLKFVLLVFLSSVLNQLSGMILHPKRKLQLSVYYGSLCSDSQEFILQQLLPAATLLRDYVNVKFIPFGKSASIDYGVNGFECQHGPTECHGNMVHDCALDLMKSDSLVLKRVKYVACEVENIAGATGDMRCVKQAGLDENEVKNCTKTDKGLNLQLESEYQTEKVDLAWIPTVILGNTFNQTFQDTAMNDLMGALCEYLKYKEPCSKYFNKMALETLLSTYSTSPVPLPVEEITNNTI